MYCPSAYGIIVSYRYDSDCSQLWLVLEGGNGNIYYRQGNTAWRGNSETSGWTAVTLLG